MSGFTQVVIFLAILFSAFFLFFVENEETPTQLILVYETSLFISYENPDVHTIEEGAFFINSKEVFFYSFSYEVYRKWSYSHSLENPIARLQNRVLYITEHLGYTFYKFNEEGLLSRKIYEHPIITFDAGVVALRTPFGYTVQSDNIKFTLTEAVPTIVSTSEKMIGVSFLNVADNLFSSVAFYAPYLIGATVFPRLVTNIYLKEEIAVITFTDTILALNIQTNEIIWQKEKMLYSHIKDKTAIYNRGTLKIIETPSGQVLFEIYEYIDYLTAYDYFIFSASGIVNALTKEGEFLWSYTPFHEVISVHLVKNLVMFKTPIEIRILTLKEV